MMGKSECMDCGQEFDKEQLFESDLCYDCADRKMEEIKTWLHEQDTR